MDFKFLNIYKYIKQNNINTIIIKNFKNLNHYNIIFITLIRKQSI